METGKYITEKLKQFNATHYYMGYLNDSYDADIKRMWKIEQQQNDRKWQEIKCNQDVLKLIERFDGAVSFVEQHVKVGHIEDAYNMALALHDALRGIRKLAQFVDKRPWSTSNFTEMSISEVDELFDRLERIAIRMEQQNFRRAMQD